MPPTGKILILSLTPASEISGKYSFRLSATLIEAEIWKGTEMYNEWQLSMQHSRLEMFKLSSGCSI